MKYLRKATSGATTEGRLQQVKSELLQTGFKRPDRRLMNICLIAIVVIMPAYLTFELAGYKKIAIALLAIAFLPVIGMVLALRSSRLKVTVRQAQSDED
jgi:hypothetical protein